jgi:hypothetical protein
MSVIWRKTKFVFFLSLILLLPACNFPTKMDATHTPTMILSSTPPLPSSTPVPIINTLTPTLTPHVSPAPTTIETTSPSGKSVILKIFLVALDDGGVSGKAVGCGDSAVPVTIEIPYTTAVLRAALTELLSIKDQYYGESGLYNALYQSDMTIDGINLVNGEAVIKLKGKFSLGGICDNPRFQAQLEETALQFSTVQKASFFINNVPLEDLLSGQ